MSGRIAVSNEEMRTVRDAMRGLNGMVDRLEAGEAEKFVLTRHGRMRAVVVSVDTFARLSQAPHGTRSAHGGPA